MNNLSPFLTLNYSCGEALQWINQNLAQKGLRVMQTFDLHDARHEMGDCPCPYHGTSKCDCQMVVLLVYSEATEPTTLILHGNNGQTWLSFVDNPPQRVEPTIRSMLEQALQHIQ